MTLPSLIPTALPFLSPFAFLCHQKWESANKLPKIPVTTPILMLSGLQDEVVPAEHMRGLWEIAKRRRTTKYSAFFRVWIFSSLDTRSLRPPPPCRRKLTLKARLSTRPENPSLLSSARAATVRPRVATFGEPLVNGKQMILSFNLVTGPLSQPSSRVYELPEEVTDYRGSVCYFLFLPPGPYMFLVTKYHFLRVARKFTCTRENSPAGSASASGGQSQSR